MKENEEQELRNAAQYLRQAVASEPIVGWRHMKTETINAMAWASMLERAADRIADLEAHLERLVA